MTAVHVVVPEGVDDPARPSGGNVYDRRVCDGLRATGWTVRELPVPGAWPCADPAMRRAVHDSVAEVPDGDVVVVDGLVASAVPDVLVPHHGRVRLVVLVHMPLGVASPQARRGEREVLNAAAAVVATSSWTRRWLVEQYGLPPHLVHVAEPGVDRAEPARGSAAGSGLLCVAAVIPGKGHDVLLSALGTMADLAWSCVCVGTLDRDRPFADAVRRQVGSSRIDERVRLAGTLAPLDLADAYAAADLLVLPSRAETYGMVVTEALARALPVIASDVGGVPDALGAAPDGSRPGLLVPPDDPVALAEGLRRWLLDAGLRARLRDSARQRRLTLSGWDVTTARVAGVLDEVAA